MDLADFQVDMDMLRSMTSSQPQEPGHQVQSQGQLLENMDYLFHQQEAMSSPFMHQPPPHQLQQQQQHHHQYMPTSQQPNAPVSITSTPVYPAAAQSDYLDQDQQQQQQQQSYTHIRKQYEELEQAKRMITQRLSELQRQQGGHTLHQLQQDVHDQQQAMQHQQQTVMPSLPPQPHQQSPQQDTSKQRNKKQKQPKQSQRGQAATIEPVTPASLMNMRQKPSMKKNNVFPSVSAKAAMQEMDQQSSLMLDALSSSSLPPPMPPATSGAYYPGATASSGSAPTATSSANRPMAPPPRQGLSSNTQDALLPPPAAPAAATAAGPTAGTASSSSSSSSSTARGGKRKSSTTHEKGANKGGNARGQRKSRRSSSYQDSKSVAPAPSSAAPHHQSPRTLKPLLISPNLNPDRQQALASAGLTPQLLPSAIHDVEHILATKSNYQNLMEGKAAALGIAFSPHIKSGLEVRRTAHKAAEQKRRDSLKEWFDRLRNEVEEGYVKQKAHVATKVLREQQREKQDAAAAAAASAADDDDATERTENDDPASSDPATTSKTDNQQQDAPDLASLKPLSKVLLLRYAYEYINYLKGTIRDRDRTIENLQHQPHAPVSTAITPPNAFTKSSSMAAAPSAPSPPCSTEPMDTDDANASTGTTKPAGVT
ncbi:hypothetical protein BC940DRAFT_323020 [Gongronella butleri]|nr:hypothetical protein BC940DRAFT_323020 [Gongronella butleri]